MCGIVGYAGPSGAFDLDTFKRCRNAMMHRGPDDQGVWVSKDGRVMLGHQRLSILELSEAGAQPMTSSDARRTIVFNGEIYNHEAIRSDLAALGRSFRGRSDTEVILEAYGEWGLDCLRRLRGMFAFGIYDHEADQLMLVRDRAGEKPLYWAHHRGGIVFASELLAFYADPSFQRRLDPLGLDGYLTYGYSTGKVTMLKGVSRIEPGQVLTVSLSTMSTAAASYWTLPPPATRRACDESALVLEFETLLKEAVGEQLRADVPVAVLLSGGTDSSLVTACAAATAGRPVSTFSVGFRGWPAGDERRYAELVASHFGTRHTELELDETSIDLLPSLARHYDEPIADSSMIPTFLLSRLVAKHTKCVLGGDGADELFGGYRSYQGAVLANMVKGMTPTVAAEIVSKAAELLPIGFRGRNALVSLSAPLSEQVAQTGVLFSERERRSLSPWLSSAAVGAARSWKSQLVETDRGIPGTYMAADFHTYLPGDILTKVDRASMANSLEVRAPFLDARIIEFAFASVPNSLRATRHERKILLKRLADRLLPRQFDATRKQGFSIPLAKWMNADYREGTLTRFERRFREAFDFSWIRTFSDSDRPGTASRTFALLLLLHWLDANDISL